MKLSIPNIEINDDRAVSPVIGVILMVAITVILAAVIGAFVLNLGQSVGQTAPRASIGVQDAGSSYTDSPSKNASIAYINHNTGESIAYENLKIVITSESGKKIATFSASDWTSAGMQINVTDNGHPQAANKFSTGDQLALNYIASKTPDLKDGTTYTFQFIHTKSGQTITTATVTIT